MTHRDRCTTPVHYHSNVPIFTVSWDRWASHYSLAMVRGHTAMEGEVEEGVVAVGNIPKVLAKTRVPHIARGTLALQAKTQSVHLLHSS
jgi:hypothetical protein